MARTSSAAPGTAKSLLQMSTTSGSKRVNDLCHRPREVDGLENLVARSDASLDELELDRCKRTGEGSGPTPAARRPSQ
jgi:hypothetical protein